MVAITAILREIMDVSLQRKMLNLEEPDVPANTTEESFIPIEANDVNEYKKKDDDRKTNHAVEQNVAETSKCDQVFETFQNDKLVVTSVWDKAFETSQKDIRMLFLEAIEDFYSVTGGPSSYEEKLVVLLEMYLKENRKLTWDEKLNGPEIRRFVFKHINELSSPPVVLNQNKNLKNQVFLTNIRRLLEDCCVSLRRKFKSKVRTDENGKADFEVIDVYEDKIRCLRVRKFFSRLNCFKRKSK